MNVVPPLIATRAPNDLMFGTLTQIRLQLGRWLPDRIQAMIGWVSRDGLDFGDRSERAAERYLKRQGMTLIERNFEDRFGEIDLIMLHNRTVVFVEVKARQSLDWGEGVEAVDSTKQQRIWKTALRFLQNHRLLESAYRFDIVSVHWPAGARRPRIDHYPNAFEPPERNQMFG